MRTVDFLFVYEVRNRELDSICLLGAYLRSKGYSVAYINSWQSFYEKPDRYKATVVVISACYHDGIYDYFAGHAFSFQKVVNLQWEQLLSNFLFDDSYLGDKYYSGISLKTRHLCWGDSNKKWLSERYGVDSKCLFIKGYLPLDFYREEFKSLLISRTELFENFCLDSRKKTLLFVSSLSYVGLPQSQVEGYIELLNRDYKKACMETQPILLDWFARFLEAHPDIQIVYRYHPAEQGNPAIQKMTENIANFYAISELPIRHWIAACDKLYNWVSSSMIEMYYSQKDTYLLRPVELPNYIDFPIYADATFLSTYEEFEQSVFEAQARENFPIPKEMLLKWYSIEGAPVYQRIGDWLIDTLHDKRYSSRPSKVNIFRPNPWIAFKKWVKNSVPFQRLATWCIDHLGENKITERLSKIKEVIQKEKQHQKAIMDENSYERSRYEVNHVSDVELQDKLAQYEAMIQQKS